MFALSLLLFAACGEVEAPAPPPPAPPPMDEPYQDEGAQVQVAFGDGGPGPSLPFAITAVSEGQGLLSGAPWHADGGRWTVLDATTADGAAFLLGVRETGRFDAGGFTMVMQDARLGVPDADAGGRFVAAFAEAFHVPEPAAGAGRGVAWIEASSVVLGEGVAQQAEGGFSGTGTWQAAKWTVERGVHASEVFVNWSLEEKRGVFSEKDSCYNADLVADFAAVLRDGQGS
ncbi:MAG: hypothetical protein ABIO70_10850 [Pseudomonadota bacterium]